MVIHSCTSLEKKRPLPIPVAAPPRTNSTLLVATAERLARPFSVPLDDRPQFFWLWREIAALRKYIGTEQEEPRLEFGMPEYLIAPTLEEHCVACC